MAIPTKKPQGRLIKTIRVSLLNQRVEAFEGNQKVFDFECVTGDKDHPTDRGVFKVLRKHHPYRSRAYNVQMDYAMLAQADAKALYAWASIGTAVHVL